MFKACRFAEATPNSVWTNQFDNTANRQAHIETTGHEIWRQTGILSPNMLISRCLKTYSKIVVADGKVDAVTFGTGTGGTMAGGNIVFILYKIYQYYF